MTDAPPARAVTITRVFDAPRELVWKAWTEPDQLARWWGRRGWSAASVAMDVRPGGTFRVVSVSDRDGREQVTEGVYREVIEPERLAFGEATMTLTDLGDGRTEMTFRTTMHAPDDVRRTAEVGMRSAFDRLAEHLAALPANPRPRSHP